MILEYYHTLIGSCNATKTNNILMKINFTLKFKLKIIKNFLKIRILYEDGIYIQYIIITSLTISLTVALFRLKKDFNAKYSSEFYQFARKTFPKPPVPIS